MNNNHAGAANDHSRPHGGPRKHKSSVPHTNTVTTKEGGIVRARIDPSLSTNDVVRQLCSNLKITESSKLFGLRTESDELVTDDNLARVIKERTPLKLSSSPAIEAAEIISKLHARDDKSLRLAVFALQKFLKEEPFVNEFILRDGLQELLDVISTAHGNTLAYALSAMDNMMQAEKGWENLHVNFIARIVQIITTENLINICRPATAILKKLVEADPSRNPAPGPSSSKMSATRVPGSIYNYGFNMVFRETRRRPSFLETVVQRLSSPDSMMALNSMRLLNALIASATDDHWEEFILQLEQLNVRKAVIRLMDSHQGEDLTSSILDFQSNIVRVTYRLKTTPVDPQNSELHREMLNRIWLAGGLNVGETGEKWTRLGFESENMRSEFARVGVLGLDSMHSLAVHDPEYFSKMILEQVNRPEERRCPFARASNEVIELLSEHWAIFSLGYTASTSFQPFFLAFQRVHNLTTRFFLRMWNESSATSYDFQRVAGLVRSQVKVALRNESSTTWFEVEKEMLESEYRTVRDRQMKEMELEDDLLNKAPIRNLRERLYTEAFNFVRDQRFQCLMEGAWFVNAIPLSGPQKDMKRPARPWRFLRLDKTKRFIYYVDSAVKTPIRGGLEELPERIEVAQIAEISTLSGAAAPGLLPLAQPDLPPPLPNSPLTAHPFSFSLLGTQDVSLADQVAENAAAFNDWVDGLNMLRKDGHAGRKETLDIVTTLTEIGLKIKLLDLTGEKIDIPTQMSYDPPPDNLDFFFSD